MAEPRFVWRPNSPAQAAGLRCPFEELLLHGNRGGGKTDWLLMDFLRDVGTGLGPAWRGIILRRKHPQLRELIAKSRKWFAKVYPTATYNIAEKSWIFPDGEQLFFAHARTVEDAENYKGHEYPWIGLEELVDWESSGVYEELRASQRTSTPGVSIRMRATTNPYGRGHNWIKAYFQPTNRKLISRFDAPNGKVRASVFSDVRENPAIQDLDEYIDRLGDLSSENKRRAWLEGDWDITSGGFLDDLWDARLHVLDPFEPPKGWGWRRSFDWGSSSPSSLGLWAISDGNPPEQYQDRHFPRGSAIRIDEWYTVKIDRDGNARYPIEGLRLDNSELGGRVYERSKGRRWSGCVGDPSMWAESGGSSIYEQMQKGAKAAGGSLTFKKADNARIAGWARVRQLLAESAKDHPEEPGLWVTSNCRHFLRTVPVVARDEDDPDDVDTDTEDHAADDTRYLAQSLGKGHSRSVEM